MKPSQARGAGPTRTRSVIEAGVGVALLALGARLAGAPSIHPHAEPDRTSSAPSLVGAPAPAELAAIAPVASYTMTASLDPVEHTIRGAGFIHFVNRSERALDHLYVHLYLNAFAHERTVFRRQRAGGFRGTTDLASPGSIHVTKFRARELDAELFPEDPTTEGDPDDATDIRVPLPRSLAPGEALTIDVAFTSTLPSVALRTGFAGSFHMAGQWFPKLARLEPSGELAHFPFQRFSEFYADFGDYDVTIDVPDAFVVGATGALVGEEARDGRKSLRFVQRGVHDFAFTAWDRFVEQTREVDGVAIRSLAPPGFERAQEVELEAASRGLAELGRRFGAYPYATLTLVHPPGEAEEAGGMEYPTLITTGGPAWMPRTGVRGIEFLTLHELAHQWFYGIVATNENRWPFLDEGVTSWATSEAARAIYGQGELTTILPLDVAALERASAARVASHAAVATPAGEFATGGDYGGLVYSRTATILRTIDRVWDGAAGRAVERWAREGRFGHPTPDHLERAIREAGGDAAGDFFHAAVFERGWVDLEAVTASARVDRDGRWVTELLVRRSGPLRVPVDVVAVHQDGATTRVTWDGAGDHHTFTIEGPTKVVSFTVDPEHRVLLDGDVLNQGWTAAGAPSTPRTRALAALAAFAGLGAVLP